MTVKSRWLSTTMLAGAVASAGSGPLAAAPATAGDDLTVRLSGLYRFNVAAASQDVRSGFGRGYWVKGDEARLQIDASASSDNGVRYGVRFDLLANTNNLGNADESFGFVSSPWGRVELGDQDDAAARMHVEADNVMVGRTGFSGDVIDYFRFGSGGAVTSPVLSHTGDATKVIYFSPRIDGLQLGASLTPDSGGAGASFNETDNDGDFENVISVGANYITKARRVTLLVSLAGEFGDDEASDGAAAAGELETVAVGATARFEGFAVGAGYVDLAERGLSTADIAAGGDAGRHWSAAAAYRSGAWGVSLGYFSSTRRQPAGRGGDTTVDILSFDGSYAVAPGWSVALSVNFIDADNIDGTPMPVGNSGSVVVFSNSVRF